MRRPYALRGCLWCGICERRMQSHWANSAPYCRCRFPAEHALANRVEHPLNVCLRNDRSEVYQQLGLRLIYQPGRKVVPGAIHLDAAGHWFLDGVRGPSRTLRT